jgi:putative PIN family toxin of toxin-antitoxin system
MLPLRLVIDTNVIVSAALKPVSLQRTALLIAINKPARLYVSQPILAEYAEVLSRPELRIRWGLRVQLLQLIKSHSHIVRSSRRIEAASDPDGQHVPRMRRCRARGLPDYRQPATLSDVLEKYKGHHGPRLHRTRSTAPASLAVAGRQGISHTLKNCLFPRKEKTDYDAQSHGYAPRIPVQRLTHPRFRSVDLIR